MAPPPFEDLPLSDSAPLAPPSDGIAAASHPFATPEADRYSGGMLIGRGGMGRVSAVHDARLGREVAKKDVPAGTPDAAMLERRLAREARITARLDHPGIVAVHDAGSDAAGRPFFTMRLIRGRSLAAALDASDLDTATLLRHFLAVCHAMAHAHARRIVHRDLKPTNLMLGPFGETQVVDWGVARQLDADPDAADLDEAPLAATPDLATEHTVAGARVGTTAWMSPEQARGEPVGTASDVFALGLVLRAILTRGAAEAASNAPEAHAILARALAVDPSDRYPDAGALAADVAAWLDGQRVSAMAYSPLELARRFYRAFRAPLLVAGAAAIVIAVIVFVSFTETRRERDRALEAEGRASRALTLATQSSQRATLALADADRAFADLLVQQSVEAVLRGARPEAELLAVHALLRGPSAVARGVLARFATCASPTLVSLMPAPVCESMRLSPGGDALLCVDALSASVWDLGATPVLRWQIPRPGDELAWLTRDLLLTDGSPRLLDADTAASLPLTSPFVVPRVRPSLATNALIDNGDELFAWTNDGPRRIPDAPRREPRAIAARSYQAITYDEERRRLSLIDLRSGTHAELALDLAADGPMSVALPPDGTTAAVGTISGMLHVVRLPDAAPLWSRSAASRPISRLAFSPDGRWIAARDDRGFVSVHDAQSADRHVLPRLPVSDLAWRETPRGLVLVTLTTGPAAGATLRSYALPRAPRPHTFHATAGISALALSDPKSESADLLALADGRGALTVSDLASGRRVAFLPGDGHAVAKDLAFLFDRPALAAIWPGQFRAAVWRLADANPTPLPTNLNYRRVVATRAGLVLSNYGRELHVLGADVGLDGLPQKMPLADGGEAVDLVASADGSTLAYLSSRGTVGITRDASPAPVTLGAPNALALALGPAGRELALVTAASARCIDLASGETWVDVEDASSRLVSVAVAAHCTWLAAGTIDGRVLVWDRGGQRVMEGRAHTQRISDLAFTADALVSASWDGTAIVWALDVLAAAPDELLRDLERGLGLGLDHALSADLR
ncbi:MAG: protein kinase [Deltaproteobacteria bacterium]|nr:protein kinase [Deltaproteobacteria bacterium]